jgi:hypothetical protein
MKLFCRKGDLIRLLVPTISAWQGIGIAAEKVYDDGDPDTVVPFFKQDQPLDNQVPSIALIGDVELIRPTNREIDRLIWQSEQNPQEYRELVREFLARWGRLAAEPVPVAERLPGSEDCNAEGECWWWDDDDDKWVLHDSKIYLLCWTHWLPHHALPLPTPRSGTH